MPYASSPEVQAYLDLKAQVEALRKQAEAEGPFEARPDMNVTPSGGEYAPAIRQVSYANILTNALGQGRQRRSKKNIADLEAKMEQARIAALRGQASGERDAARAADLQTLGAPEALVSAATPAPPINPSALGQIIATGQNPDALAAAGIITPEVAAQMKAEIASRQQATTAAEQAEFDRQKQLQAQKDAEAMRRAQLRAQQGGAGAGGIPAGAQNKVIGDVGAAESYEAKLAAMEDFIRKTPQAFSVKERTLAAASGVANAIPGIGPALGQVADIPRGPESREFESMVKDVGIERLQAFGGQDSDRDVSIVMSLLPRAQDSQEVALQMVQQARKIAQAQALAKRLFMQEMAAGRARPGGAPDYYADAKAQIEGGGAAPPPAVEGGTQKRLRFDPATGTLQ